MATVAFRIHYKIHEDFNSITDRVDDFVLARASKERSSELKNHPEKLKKLVSAVLADAVTLFYKLYNTEMANWSNDSYSTEEVAYYRTFTESVVDGYKPKILSWEKDLHAIYRCDEPVPTAE